MSIKNLVNKCYHCKRVPATHLGKRGQLEIRVCKKCGDKLKNTFGLDSLIERR